MVWLAGDQVKIAHQLPDELGADLLVRAKELGVDPAIPVGVIGELEDCSDEFLEVLAANLGGRGRPVSPFIEFYSKAL